MRVVVAGLLVVGGTGAIVLGLGSRFPGIPPELLGLAGSVVMILLCLGALVLFNSFASPFSGSAEDHIRTMEEKGSLTSADLQATRAFGVEEWEDEGPHYFLELVDGAVLYLNGQYLMDYEPLEDDEDDYGPRPRLFPCTEFTVRRHVKGGYVVDIDCRGAALEPEVLAPTFSPEEFRRGAVPKDGEIIRDRSYDEIKAERMRG